MLEHDQPDHEGLFPSSKRKTSKKLRLQSRYCEYMKLGFFFETYSRKETRIGKYMDLGNKPNMKRTQIGGGYMVVYGSGGGIWQR